MSSISCSLCEFFIYARNRHRTGIPQRLVPVGTVPLIRLTVINHVRISSSPFPISSCPFCGRRLLLPLALATCQPSQPASGTMCLPRSVVYAYNALTADLHSAVLPWQFVPNTTPTDRYLFRFDAFPLSRAHDLTFLFLTITILLSISLPSSAPCPSPLSPIPRLTTQRRLQKTPSPARIRDHHVVPTCKDLLIISSLKTQASPVATKTTTHTTHSSKLPLICTRTLKYRFVFSHPSSLIHPQHSLSHLS